MRKLFILFFWFTSTIVSAQLNKADYRIHASFLEDSFFIGQHLHFNVGISYPKNNIAILPDSSCNFFPFEYVNKIYYPTRTDSLRAYDSITYILTSFEIYRTQSIFLPIFFFVKKDTLNLQTQSDSIHLKRIITSTSEKDVQADATLIQTPADFNYPYAIALGIGVFLLLIVLYKIFGKFIIKSYRLFILRTIHNNFIKDFDSLLLEFKTSEDLRVIEQTLSIWKTYLTRLENKPINTYTTKELILLYEQEELESTLQSLDRNVYGGVVTKNSYDELQTIRKFTNRRFQIRRRFIANG